MPRDHQPQPIDSIDAHNRWLRLRDTAQLAADLLASAERCGADRDTMFDLVSGALDGLANLAADNERKSDERGVLSDWLSFGNATAALDLWEAWLQAHRWVKPALPVVEPLAQVAEGLGRMESNASGNPEWPAVHDMVEVARRALGIRQAAG